MHPYPTTQKPSASRSPSTFARFKYSVTTLLPGASEVFTHGFRVSPSAFAFFATKPAASITLGFDVFVQDVIAAIATFPSFISKVSPSHLVVTDTTESCPNVSVRSSCHLDFISVNKIRSCGRFGPANDGATVDKSNSATVVYIIGRESSLQSPCNLQYCSTVSISFSSRPVKCKYFVVCSSTGKKPIVAPYSGAMFASVARVANVISPSASP